MFGYNCKKEIIYSIALFSIALVLTILLLGTIFYSDDGILSSAVRFFFWSFLCYGMLIYLISRYGFFKRLLHYKSVESGVLESFLQTCDQKLTYLVPSYKEEIPVIRKTLLSAALQKWQDRHVALLIDDPPNPKDPKDKENLEAARNLPKEISELLASPRELIDQLYTQHLERIVQGNTSEEYERFKLSQAYLEAKKWFLNQRQLELQADHTDSVFIELTFDKRAEELESMAKRILHEPLVLEEITRAFKCLTSLFDAKISSFERKKYLNLSLASNKAMNVNSYLNVMGHRYKETLTEQGLLLEKTEKGPLYYEDSHYIAVLDADTILTYDYSLKLIHEMEQPENQKVAVIQTPYSAFPKPPGLLERAAGATTDLMYIIHQGFTHFGATFWVGANAITRKEALDQIAEPIEERGYRMQRYIQDRTVIEDTESSIDLAAKRWQLSNYPERLSYSSTPEDFGALLIQRRRWANGGLLILPKLFKYLFKMPFHAGKIHEFVCRFYYLFSLPALAFGVLLSAGTATPSPLEISLCILASLPYFIAYGRDLKYHGYRYRDLFRVIALNILLIPVNMAGVFKSCEQAITGKQIPFLRTPKTHNRTHIPGIYIFGQLAILGSSLYLTIQHLIKQEWGVCGYQLLLLFTIFYAISAYIGFGNALADLSLSVKRSMKLIFFRRAGESSSG